ncbi:aminomethyl-transferring glycine dehydrogenase subunit GcvPA [Nocardioides sp. Arc9.136]|uniref:aminomethyl-transferring glycine dehydrogenase subunit GcvPA n=1 Tax=Nocardioides sp. Arc9.136 TaxID=2996826 RepID=UPI0026660B12|nr:aminomethyl-transferring glycine dehydrogenase subunit GcvPA [Nocardioides sp. Arc9.136]WKN48497.1 aminomethyl-transferring glycine dehydrogenase subunit GcvPA [Nocardioides sp. Arc9.136]
MAHPYMPNSTAEAKARMLAYVGVDDVEELFEQIPADHVSRSGNGLAPGIRSEATLRRRVRTLVDRNDDCVGNLSFLGAGTWQHHVPAVVDEIVGRSEFLTPVWGTPSSDLGRNQAWFEYASMLGELLGMDFVGLPVYSWGAAAGNALRMAARLTGRGEVVVPASISPERLAVIRTYCGLAEGNQPIAVRLVDVDPATGCVDVSALALDADTAAVYLETPNHLGVVETATAEIAAACRANGTETVLGVDPVSLGLLAAPGDLGADIVVGSTQPLGVHLHAGGGVGGFIATRDEERYAREYPTLQVSLAETVRGERTFGMALFHQTSYGSREDGNDWTGNSVYLWTVANAVYMALLGPEGFAELGRTILSNARYAAGRVAEVDGVEVRWPDSFFKEFVVDLTATGRTVAEVNAGLREHGIFGGKDLSADFPWLGQSALFCVTEIHTADDIDHLVQALKEVLS